MSAPNPGHRQPTPTPEEALAALRPTETAERRRAFSMLLRALVDDDGHFGTDKEKA